MICRNVRCEAPRQRGSDGGAGAGSPDHAPSRAPSTNSASPDGGLGLDLVGGSRAELDAFRREQTKQISEIVKATGVTVKFKEEAPS